MRQRYDKNECCGRDACKVKLLGQLGILYLDSCEFLFDAEDLPLIQSRVWYRDKDGYLVSSYYYAGVRRFVRFHRIVMNARPTQIVDHINNNRSDNRKFNLRCCERCENDRNRCLYSNNTSGVSGVHFDKQRKKWCASITYNKRKINIGRFDLKEDAVMARLQKEVELFQSFAPQFDLWLEMLALIDT